MRTEPADGAGFVAGLWVLLGVGAVGCMIAGAAFGSITLFHTYGSAFSHLEAANVHQAQLLYNDTVARELKDTLLQQQIDLLNAELAAESIVREAGFQALYWAISNETAARIAEEAPLFSGLANETATRTAIDVFFADEIANLTAGVVQAEQYETYSKSVFTSIFANITSLQVLLANEVAARIAEFALLTEQGAISDAAIAYLTTTLEHEIHDRTVQDVLIDEWIAALQVLGLGIESINGQTGSINNNVDIVSLNALTTITAPSAGQLLFTNNALLTLEGVPPNGSNNIALAVGPGLNLVGNGPHGLHISASYMPIGPNVVTLLGAQANPIVTSGMVGSNYISLGCVFLANYNGGTCGWSAPDSGTYIVHISATVTACVSSDGPDPTVVHVNMALGRTSYNAAQAAPRAFTENTGGVLDIVDGSFIGTALSVGNNYCMDMGLTATTIVQGAGVAGSGGIASGYGVFPYFQGALQVLTLQPITVYYHVTKVP
jgi:hypothetical protein